MAKAKFKKPTPLLPIPLIGPGFRGLNTTNATSVGSIDPLWALVLQDCVFDEVGRISLRKGWVNQTTTAMTGGGLVYVEHEYLRDDGTRSIVALKENHTFWISTDDGDTWTEITGSISTTTVKWKFVNFVDKLYATAPGHKIWVYTGTGNFTQVTNSDASNGTLLAAFGRLWSGKDASSTINYSVLLDGTDFAGTGSGSIDAANAWTSETDEIMGLAAFGATFVVFGRSQILIYVDGTGSVLGIDPDNMYVVDTVEGTGLEFRDSIVSIGEGDLWFISRQGVQSLKRVVADKVNPLADITKNVRALTRDLIANEVGATGIVKGIFSPDNQFVLYLFPESNKILLIDTKIEMEDGTYRVAEWVGLTDFSALMVRKNNDILFGLSDGKLGLYTGYRDNGSTKYSLVYSSPWLDFGPEVHNRLKIIKQFYGIFFGRETLTAIARWAVDFRPLEFTETFTNDFDASGAEFGAGEYGESDYGDGHRLRRQYIAGAGEGQFIKVQVALESTDVDAIVAIQEMGVFAKLGRFV